MGKGTTLYEGSHQSELNSEGLKESDEKCVQNRAGGTNQ